MELSLNLHIALWVWIIVGAAGVVGASGLVLGGAGKTSTKWWEIVLLLGMGVVGSGLLTLAVLFAGWPTTALYLWRATSMAVTLLGIALLAQDNKLAFSDSSEPRRSANWSQRRWSAAISTLILAGLTWLSFQIHSPLKSAELSASSATPSQVTFSLFSFVGGTALILLAAGTIIFLALFVQRLRHGGSPQVEAHWGGIGGGLGGWRMSPALGYLLVAVLLALLFTLFLFKLDSPERGGGVTMPSPTVAPKAPEAIAATPVPSKESAKGTR